MPALPLLTVVFVGIGGADATRVEHQMQSLLHKDARVEATKISPAQLRTLARHGDGCRAIVRGLHAEGVVGGELIESHGGLTLRVVVYDGDGAMKDLVETPLSGRALGRDEIESLRSNLMPDVVDLVKGGDAPSDSSEPTEPTQVDDDDAPAALPIKRAPVREAASARSSSRPAPRAKPAPKHDDADGDGAGIEMDAETHEAAPTETADASDSVSADEVMQLAMGGESETGGGPIATASSSDGLRLRAAVGFGVTGRDFAGPSTVAGYASSGVGAIRLDASVAPTTRTTLSMIAERAVGMTTPLMDGAAPTTQSRWQVAASYALTTGAIRFAPMIGTGDRAFEIDSKDASRTPDAHYGYLVAGASLSAQIGRVSLGGLAAFEPVIGGAEPTEMAFGEASRWALELGGAIEVRATSHVFVRTAFDWQRFSWAWDAAGARAQDGAVDSYPTGTVSVGADY